LKIALISDIHGNLAALEAVLSQIDLLEVDSILCLGDVVGYGPQPNECIDILINRGIPTLLGNHDACVIGRLNDRFFNEPNRGLLRWTRSNLKKDQIDWLESLPLLIEGIWCCDNNENNAIQSNKEGCYTYLATHASPQNPDAWEWLDSAIRCREILMDYEHDFVLVGHTHIPALIANEIGVFGLEKGYRFMVNPGAVGQSRDHDRRASFCTLDLKGMRYNMHRVDYEISRNWAILQNLGYKDNDIKRLLNI
jgi:predicted phosphodiesterase